MQKLIALLLLSGACAAQDPPAQPPDEERRLKSRTEVPKATAHPVDPNAQGLWVIPAGAKLPIQLRQPISTKDAKPGDAIYAQTSFPVVIDSNMAIPAGTWVQGMVDSVKRAGRIKGTAELQFHLTTLIYANGYTVDMAAAIDKVPGSAATHMREPGTVQHDSEKGKDLERIGDGASKGGQIGSIAGAATTGSIRGLGVGGLTGIAAGTLIALLARGGDVMFTTGPSVEISLSHAIAIEPERVLRAANGQPRVSQ